MAVQFLLVLFLEAKDDLNRAGVHRGFSGVGTNNAGGILENVCGDCLAVDGVFSDTLLVAAHLRSGLKLKYGMSVWKFLDSQG